MRALISSNIMRTTIDLDATVLDELRRRSRETGKSMGRVASELLARSLDEQRDTPPPFSWESADLGKPRVDLEDDEAVWAVLEDRA